MPETNTNVQEKQKCNRCKVTLTLDKFKRKRNGQYMKQCVDCNETVKIWANKRKKENEEIPNGEEIEGQKCNMCKEIKSLDCFKQKRNKEYLKRCIECNDKTNKDNVKRKKEIDKMADAPNKRKCNRCQVILSLDKFKQKRNGEYMSNCIECNNKKNVYLNKNKCKHGKRPTVCRDCDGFAYCEHDIIKSICKDCKGGSICLHNAVRSVCVECNGGSICLHNINRTNCRECGNAYCEHDCRRADCRECHGRNICEHNLKRANCRDCKGKNICPHSKIRSRCKKCDFGGYLRHAVGTRISHALKTNKSKSTIEYLGCNIEFFKQYIEAQFHPGMSWDNYGEWEMDHIVGVMYNNPTLEEQIVRLHYTNNQPLWRDENNKKSNKLVYGVIYNHNFHSEFTDCN